MRWSVATEQVVPRDVESGEADTVSRSNVVRTGFGLTGIEQRSQARDEVAA